MVEQEKKPKDHQRPRGHHDSSLAVSFIYTILIVAPEEKVRSTKACNSPPTVFTEEHFYGSPCDGCHYISGQSGRKTNPGQPVLMFCLTSRSAVTAAPWGCCSSARGIAVKPPSTWASTADTSF